MGKPSRRAHRLRSKTTNKDPGETITLQGHIIQRRPNFTLDEHSGSDELPVHNLEDLESVESDHDIGGLDMLAVASWTEEVMELLEGIRLNSVNLSDYHRRRFYYFKGYSKYFDLPVLVLSSMSASFSVGTQAYLSQEMISAITCFVGILVSIITSIKLYLNITDSMQVELKMSKEFYTLGIDIYRITHLPPQQRGMDGVDYLNRQYGTYSKLVESSNLLRVKFKKDQLTPIRKKFTFDPHDSSSDDSPQSPRLHKQRSLQSIPEVEIVGQAEAKDASV